MCFIKSHLKVLSPKFVLCQDQAILNQKFAQDGFDTEALQFTVGLPSSFHPPSASVGQGAWQIRIKGGVAVEVKKRKKGLGCKRKAGSIASDLGGKCLGFKEHEIL